MALFGGSRDVSLFHNLNKELINDIIQTEIAYYKFALEQTKINVYGEAPGKQYFEPLKIACLIDKQDQDWSVDDFGPNVNQSINFRFLKEELKGINLVPHESIREKVDYSLSNSFGFGGTNVSLIFKKI